MKNREGDFAGQKQSTIIVSEESLAAKLSSMRAGGAAKLHVLADFDSTLTLAFKDGVPVGSTNSAYRRGNLLGEEYGLRALALYHEYHAYEIDPTMTREDKTAKMLEWWHKVYELQRQSGLTRDIVKAAAAEVAPYLRPGTKDLLQLLQARGVPLVLMSAGLGDVIEGVFRDYHAWFTDVHIVSNRYRFDAEGRMVGVVEPLIYPQNKNEVTLRQLPDYEAIKERRNVLLLGDGLHDPDMVIGFEYDHLLKIGFLNEKVEEHLPAFREAYDVVITGDAGLEPVVTLLREIVKA